MARQNINKGSYPNDPTADSVARGFEKVNDMMKELYPGLDAAAQGMRPHATRVAMEAVTPAAGDPTVALVMNDLEITADFAPAGVDIDTDTITAAGHNLSNDERVSLSTTDTLPAPLSGGSEYYIIGATADTFQLAGSKGGAAIDLLDQGIGTHTVTKPNNNGFYRYDSGSASWVKGDLTQDKLEPDDPNSWVTGVAVSSYAKTDIKGSEVNRGVKWPLIGPEDVEPRAGSNTDAVNARWAHNVILDIQIINAEFDCQYRLEWLGYQHETYGDMILIKRFNPDGSETALFNEVRVDLDVDRDKPVRWIRQADNGSEWFMVTIDYSKAAPGERFISNNPPHAYYDDRISPSRYNQIFDRSDVYATNYRVLRGQIKEGYYYNYQDGFAPDPNRRTLLVDVNNLDKSKSIFRATATIEGTGTSLAVFLDQNEQLIGDDVQGTTSDVKFRRKEINVPENAYYVAISNHGDNHPMLEYGKQEKYTNEEIIKTNHWYNKKILFLGTSVTFGRQALKSYADEAARRLGYNLVNTGLPGQAIAGKPDGMGGVVPDTFGSSALSIQEHEDNGFTIPASPIDYEPNGDYNDFYRSWENIFRVENRDADLFVYAVTPNNEDFGLADWNDFNKQNWTYTTGTFEDHRTTFLGALIYLFNKMYTLVPDARAVLLLDSEFAYPEGKDNFQKFADEFNIPIIDLYGKLNINPKTQLYIRSHEGSNPHPSTKAHDLMGKMLANELKLIA